MDAALANQTILITGGGGGLGGTAAVALAKQGAHIILLDKKIPKMEQVYDRILQAGGVEPTMYPFDLAGADETQYQELAEIIDQQYGKLAGILHSAVDLSAYSPVSQISCQEWGQTITVNLNACFLLSRVLLPVLQKSEHASIVFTSDSSARNAPAYSGAYGVSKVAIEGFAQILAKELETAGIVRVNVLAPGAVNSPLRKKIYPAEDKSQLAAMESLEAVYCYLFSDQSLNITGQIIQASTFKP